MSILIQINRINIIPENPKAKEDLKPPFQFIPSNFVCFNWHLTQIHLHSPSTDCQPLMDFLLAYV